MTDFDINNPFAGLEDDLSQVPTKRTDPKFERRKFTCESCGGTGRWSGGRNRHGNHKCWTCHGYGHLVTSPEQRAKARASERRLKERKFEAAQEANEAYGGGELLQFIRNNSDWNDFCASLLDQHERGRAFSEKQVEAARRMWVKIEEKRRERKHERETALADAPKADGTRIREMFDTALANGKKQRSLHAGHFGDVDPETGKPELLNKVVMTPARAPRTEIWIKVDGEFCGGIKGDGTIDLRRGTPDWLPNALQRIAANPDEECRLYGRRTGICSCCGRTLTNGISIELGIGPICRGKWGLG